MASFDLLDAEPMASVAKPAAAAFWRRCTVVDMGRTEWMAAYWLIPNYVTCSLHFQRKVKAIPHLRRLLTLTENGAHSIALSRTAYSHLLLWPVDLYIKASAHCELKKFGAHGFIAPAKHGGKPLDRDASIRR